MHLGLIKKLNVYLKPSAYFFTKPFENLLPLLAIWFIIFVSRSHILKPFSYV